MENHQTYAHLWSRKAQEFTLKLLLFKIVMNALIDAVRERKKFKKQLITEKFPATQEIQESKLQKRHK